MGGLDGAVQPARARVRLRADGRPRLRRALRRPALGACLTTPRGRDRGGFRFSRGGADVVGSIPNEEATTMDETKSARVRRVGRVRGVCGVARLGRSAHYALRRAPCIRSLTEAKRLTRNSQTGSRL